MLFRSKGNKDLVRETVEREIPGIKVVPSQATYLLWLDCSGITEDAGELAAFIRSDTGLYLTEGEEYGAPGRSFLRLNTACPRQRLIQGLSRLQKGIRDFGLR